ncbi:MAG: hypothetical protein V3W51_04590 [Candidatus Brocadiales bacterium]
MSETLDLIETIGTITGIIVIGIWLGTQQLKTNTMWRAYKDNIITKDRTDILWTLMVEPAIKKGLLLRESDMHITAKGREILDQARNRMEVRCQELLAEGLSTHAILSDIHPQIMLLAEELGEEPGAVFGLVEVHINEKRSAS